MLATHPNEISLPPRHGRIPGNHGQVTVYTAGRSIYDEGDPATSLFQIQFGCVRIYRILADGRRQICAFHYAGETFGLEVDGQHRFFAEAVVATGVRRLPFKPDTGISSVFPDVLDLALRTLACAHGHLMILARQGACERIAAFLIDTAERQGGLDRFDLPMSRADIGDHLGLTIETVSRAFSRLRRRGLIDFPNLRSLHILNRSALEAIAD